MRLAACVSALTVAFLGLSQVAVAQQTLRARLLTTPTAESLSDHFPPVPLSLGVSGRATLSCDVAADGHSECRAEEEAPANMGFAAAAEALASDWRFTPAMENGDAIASTVRTTIVFTNEFNERAPIDPAIYVAPPDERAPANEIVDGLVVNACRIRIGRPCSSHVVGTLVQTIGYPAEAEAAGVTGRALLACVVRSNRSLDCGVEGAAPAGHGFGEAALGVIGRLDSAGAQREPGAVFRIPVEFALRDESGRVQQHWYFRDVDPGDDVRRFLPERALQSRQDGDVMLVCSIPADLRLDCDVETETPSRFGYGVAALRLMDDYGLNDDAVTMPGFAVGDRIRIPVSFRLNE